MFIDIHAHAYRDECPLADGCWKFATAAEVIKRYDELGIQKGFLLPLIGPEYYLPQSNEDILDMCAESHGRLLPFCNIDPRGISNSPDANFSLWLEHYKKRGCIGVGEVMPNLPFGDPRCQNLFKHVETVGLPFTFDISAAIGGNYGFYDDPGLPQLELTLRKFPKLNICCHGPAFWAEISTLDTPADRFIYPRYPVRAEGVVPKLFRRYANAWGDLSARSAYYALSRDADFAVSFITEFQDKLMFATDICYADMELPMAGFLQGLRDQKRISEEIFEKVAHKNARRLFGLDSSFPE